MAVSDHRSENRNPNIGSNAGSKTPRQLRLRGSPPKKSSPKRTSPHKGTRSSSASPSPCTSSEEPNSKHGDQPATLCPAIIKLGYRICPNTPPKRAPPLAPPSHKQQHSPRQTSPRQSNPLLLRIQQQQPPEGLTTWPPLPAFELLVPHVLPYPPVQPRRVQEPSTPVRMLSPAPTQPSTPERCEHPAPSLPHTTLRSAVEACRVLEISFVSYDVHKHVPVNVCVPEMCSMCSGDCKSAGAMEQPP